MPSEPNDDPGAAPEPAFDAVILAGGRAARLDGQSKPDVLVAGRRLLDHALDAATLARRIVVVGPPDLVAVPPRGAPPVLATQEDPPWGGPVAGVDAGLRALERAADRAGEGAAELILLLACDVPSASNVVGRLLQAAAVDVLAGGDGAQLVDRGGRVQPLVGAYRRPALTSALERLAASSGVRGASLRQLLSGAQVRLVADLDDDTADADTWHDVARLDALLVARQDAPPRPQA